MVPKKGLSCKYREGERVLCYEPDPTKPKGLYEVKVLETLCQKYMNGGDYVGYLIHFNGFHDTWTRYVHELLVLKDTPEHRQLQIDLAEKSQLDLVSFLYTPSSEIDPNDADDSTLKKHISPGLSEDAPTSSIPDAFTKPENLDDNSDKDPSASNSSDLPYKFGRPHIELPNALRDRLRYDYHLVIRRNKVSRLPISLCMAKILDSLFKSYARGMVRHPLKKRFESHQRPNMLNHSRRLNLIREIADGLPVYVDLDLHKHLLYVQKAEEYYKVCENYRDQAESMDVDEQPPFIATTSCAVTEELTELILNEKSNSASNSNGPAEANESSEMDPSKNDPNTSKNQSEVGFQGDNPKTEPSVMKFEAKSSQCEPSTSKHNMNSSEYHANSGPTGEMPFRFQACYKSSGQERPAPNVAADPKSTRRRRPRRYETVEVDYENPIPSTSTAQPYQFPSYSGETSGLRKNYANARLETQSEFETN